MAGRVWGPKGAPLVLALHGWLDNAGSFDRLAPLLPGLRILALDLPGHGRSTHNPAGVLYPFVDLVSAVFWAVESLEWKTFAMIGHSLGAGVAAVLAGTFPDRVVRLALLDGLGPLSESPEDAPLRLARALNEQRRKAGRKPPIYPSQAHVRERLQAAASQLSLSASDCLLDRGLEERDGGVGWRTDRRLRFGSRMRFTEEQVQAFLRKISCPTMLVRPNEGFAFSVGLARDRTQCVEDIEIAEVKGRHHVHLDYPERVAPALTRFFAPLTRGPVPA